MAKNQLEIFATSTDFVGILRVVEEQLAIAFFVAGMFETGTIRRLDASIDVLRAMTVPREDQLVFLAVEEKESVGIREVAQKKGGVRYCIDQLCNPKSVVLRPGGMVEENTILAGQIGTTSQAPASLQLFAAFSRAVRQNFVKVKSYWVGPEAIRVLDGGGRLTANLKAASDYDLRR